MQRYFVHEENWQGNNVFITGTDAHHIINVMRMRTGDEIIGVHPDKGAAKMVIATIVVDQVTCQFDKWMDATVELPVNVTIAQGLPKGDKWKSILQKGTELGAYDFIPFKAVRSVVKWDDKKAKTRLARYQKIVKEAAEQSHRTKLPDVHMPMDLDELIETTADYDVCIYAYEEQAKNEMTLSALAQVLRGLTAGSSILVCIGPEGGLDPKEVTAFNQAGFTPVRTGPRILRTETAPLYVLAAVSYQLEELGCQL